MKSHTLGRGTRAWHEAVEIRCWRFSSFAPSIVTVTRFGVARMAKIALAILATAVAFPFASAAQDVVTIDDTIAPQTASQIFTQKCPNGHSYSLERTQMSDGRRLLIARTAGRSEPVETTAILNQVTDVDFYAVRMTCGGSDAYFKTKIARPDGRVSSQDIVISYRTGVKVYPTESSTISR